jgi:hypothetical protein
MTDVLRDLVEQTTAFEEPAVTTGSTGECGWLPQDEQAAG